jgi:two-component system, response regulator, stage 0 sporulation protein A
MNINQSTKEKLEKTIERMQKALEYNDQGYISELVHDLTEFAYFAGYKEAESNQFNHPTKKIKGTYFTPISTGTIEAQISTLVFDMGIPSHIKGYRYLIDAVALTYEDPTLISKITKELYPYIARKNNTTASRVERAIRHSIEIGWSRGNPERTSMILGYPVTKTKVKPTNSEYIHLLSNYLRINNENPSTLNSSTEYQPNENKKINQDQPIDGANLKLVQLSEAARTEISTEVQLEENTLKTDNDMSDKELTTAINEILCQLDFKKEMSHFPLLRTLIYLSIRNPHLLKDEIELHNQLANRFGMTKERMKRVIQDALSMRFPALKETLRYQGLNPMKLSVFAELVIKKLNLV